MSGYRIPALGDTQHERPDAGTAARTATPAPGPLRVAPAQRAPTAAASAPWTGSVPVALGAPSVVRIPLPGSDGLCIEFRPRGWQPRGGSTSTLFLQDASGRRHLRLDHGYNVRTKSIDYHWNQSGTSQQFGLANHAPAGRAGAAAYRAAKAFRHLGRALLVVGAVIDGVSIVQADRPIRRASQVVVAWAAAWAGCKVVGAGGAALGSLASPLGSAAGGVVGCIVGGYAGYESGTVVAGEVFDWAEGTRFTPLPEVAAP